MQLYTGVFIHDNSKNTYPDEFYRDTDPNTNFALCREAFFKSELHQRMKFTLHDSPVLKSHKIYLERFDTNCLYWSRNKKQINEVFTSEVTKFLLAIIPKGDMFGVVSVWYTVEKLK